MYFDVQTCTKQNPFFSCLCLWSDTLTRILYFEVQTGTKTNLSLVFNVYGVVLLLASCTLVYKRAPEQAYFSCLSLWDGTFTRILYFDVPRGTKSNHFLVVYVMGWCFFSHLVLRCTNRHQNKPISICLCSRDGAFTNILYFGAQTGTKTSLFLVIYYYGVVLLLVSCTSKYKQAPNQNFF